MLSPSVLTMSDTGYTRQDRGSAGAYNVLAVGRHFSVPVVDTLPELVASAPRRLVAQSLPRAVLTGAAP